MARAATSPELELLRSDGQWSRLFGAIYTPSVIYTGRINQSFSSLDRILELIYDGGVGTLGNVLPDMTLYIGSTAGAWDIGIARVRGIDGSKVYIGVRSDLSVANDQYLTIVDDFGLWAKTIVISAGVAYMDGGVAYSDQHTNWLPFPKMGPDRAGKLTGSDISFEFDFSGSFVPGSTISGFSTSCATASGISGASTSTPTIEINTTGWHLVYLTLTAANGKSSFGVRKIYVYSDEDPPLEFRLDTAPRGDVDSGGWQFNLTLFEGADLIEIRDHSFVMLFTEDHFGDTAQSIGPAEGAENILNIGWIAKESIDFDPEAGSVSFTAYTAQYWLQRIPSWPGGVEFSHGDPASWIEIRNLTIDLGLAHFFLWRTTAPRVIDITLPGDTRYTLEVISLASDLWSQVVEMAWDKIYARPLVNCLNQLFIEIHPQLVPSGSRSWPTVMAILPEDWIRPISFERVTMEDLSILDLSGVAINSAGASSGFFSLAPGRAHSRYGQPTTQNQKLLLSQAQANTLAGLYRSWKNNRFPSIPIRLKGNNRLIDIAPRQKCTIAITAGQTERDLSYSGGLIPLSIERSFDQSSGYLRSDISFEGETAEGIATAGDPPGSINISLPPITDLPPLPDLDILIPGPIGDSSSTPEAGIPIVLFDVNLGLIFGEIDLNNDVQWRIVNSGLTQAQYQTINIVKVLPAGGIYVAHRKRTGFGTNPFIAYAPYIGGSFTVIEDIASIEAKLGSTGYQAVNGIGINRLNGQVAYVISVEAGAGQSKIYIGSGLSFSAGADLSLSVGAESSLSFGNDNWRLTSQLGGALKYIALTSNAGSIVRSVDMSGIARSTHLPISTTDEVYVLLNDGRLTKITQNGAIAGDFTAAFGSDLNNLDFWDAVASSDPSGDWILARWNVGARGRSTDGGTTWAGLPNLPFGNWWFAYCGGSGTSSIWVAAGGTSIYISRDGGVNWTLALGDILSVATPLPSLGGVYNPRFTF